LFVIGNANKLLKTNTYPDDSLLYKFGNTDDLPRRSAEHERDFKRIFKIDHIELMIFSVIDPKYIFDAETSLKDYFKSNKVDYENTRELIVLDKTEYEKATKHYKLIKNSYIGCYKEMQSKIDTLERRILELQNECNLMQEKHKNLVQEKDSMMSVIVEKHKNLIQEKDNNLIIKEKEIEYIKEKYQNEMIIKEKDNLIALNETKNQNEILLMKTQLLELQLAKYEQLLELSQVSKPKTKKAK
jgi:hypothetical protein